MTRRNRWRDLRISLWLSICVFILATIAILILWKLSPTTYSVLLAIVITLLIVDIFLLEVIGAIESSIRERFDQLSQKMDELKK